MNIFKVTVSHLFRIATVEGSGESNQRELKKRLREALLKDERLGELRKELAARTRKYMHANSRRLRLRAAQVRKQVIAAHGKEIRQQDLQEQVRARQRNLSVEQKNEIIEWTAYDPDKDKRRRLSRKA